MARVTQDASVDNKVTDDQAISDNAVTDDTVTDDTVTGFAVTNDAGGGRNIECGGGGSRLLSQVALLVVSWQT